MDSQLNLFFASVVFTFLLTSFLAIYAFRVKKLPGVRAYALLALSESLGSLAEILSMISNNQQTAIFWWNVRFLPFAFISGLFVIFAFRYNEHMHWIPDKAVWGLLIIPVITQVMVWTNGRYHLWVAKDAIFLHMGNFWLADITAREPAIWFLVYTFYNILLMLTGITILLITAWQNRKKSAWQSILLTLGALVGLVILLTTTFNLLPDLRVNIFIPGLGLSALFYALAVLRFDFLKKPGRSLPKGEIDNIQAQDKRSFTLFFIIFIITASGFFALGNLSYQQYSARYLDNVNQQLNSIAKLKVDSISAWRRERTADVQSLAQNPTFLSLVDQYIHGGHDPAIADEIEEWFITVGKAYDYNHIYLADSQGNMLFSTPNEDHSVPEHVLSYIKVDFIQKSVSWVDFHRHENGEILLAIVSPIFSATNSQIPLGLLVFELSPDKWLYPYMQTWPIPSETAETLLVRKEGNGVLFLTPLRFNPKAALNQWISFENSEVLGVKGGLGIRGVVEGLDYRGQEVIGSIQQVPDSPWILVARMDKAEVDAPLKTRLWQTILFFGFLVIGSGTGLALIWRNNRMRYYHSQLLSAEKIREEEEKFRTAFQTSPDALTITRMKDGLILLYNDALKEILGFTDEDLHNKSSYQLRIWNDFEDRDRLITLLRENGSVKNFAAKFRRKDETLIDGLMSATMIKIGGESCILNTTRDVTELKKIEDQLRQTSDYLHNLITYANAPIITWNAENRITLFNQAFEHFTGHATADVLGEKIDMLFPENSREESIKKIQQAVSGEYWESVEIPILTADGKIKVALWNSANIYEQNGTRLIATIAQGQDITERKEIEQKLKEYSEHLEELVEARTRDLKKAQEHTLRQERLAAIGQLAGSIAHELRNPLGVISNAVTYLSMIQAEADPKVTEYLKIIKNETNSSEKIITDLLEFTHLQVAERKPVPVADLISNSVRRFPPPSHIEVQEKIDENLPTVYVNGLQLEQVLGNLLTNAYQAMPDGGKVELTAQLEEANDQQTKSVRICVTDNGEGIKPENLNLIFEPLFTTKSKGIGLGLPLCKKFIEANKGEISVTSKVNIGTTFTIILPTEKETP